MIRKKSSKSKGKASLMKGLIALIIGIAATAIGTWIYFSFLGGDKPPNSPVVQGGRADKVTVYLMIKDCETDSALGGATVSVTIEKLDFPPPGGRTLRVVESISSGWARFDFEGDKVGKEFEYCVTKPGYDTLKSKVTVYPDNRLYPCLSQDRSRRLR